MAPSGPFNEDGLIFNPRIGSEAATVIWAGNAPFRALANVTVGSGAAASAHCWRPILRYAG